jgi:hypothetical protein
MLQPDRPVIGIEESRTLGIIHMERALNPQFLPFNINKWARAYDQLTNNLEASPAGYAKIVFSKTFGTDRWQNGRECNDLHEALMNGALRAYDALRKVPFERQYMFEYRIGKSLAWAARWPRLDNFRHIDVTQRLYDRPESDLAYDIPYFTVAREIARRDDADAQWKLWELAVTGLKNIQGDVLGAETSEQLLADIWTMDTLKPDDPSLTNLTTMMTYVEYRTSSGIDFSHTVETYIKRIKTFFPPGNSRGIVALRRVMEELVTLAHPESLRYVVEIMETVNPDIRKGAETLFGRFIKGSPEKVGDLFQKLLQSKDPHDVFLAQDYMLPFITRARLPS